MNEENGEFKSLVNHTLMYICGSEKFGINELIYKAEIERQTYGNQAGKGVGWIKRLGLTYIRELIK